MTDNAKLYISTTQQETASLSDPNTLLARDVYDRLYTLIGEAQQEANKALKSSDHDFDSLSPQCRIDRRCSRHGQVNGAG